MRAYAGTHIIYMLCIARMTLTDVHYLETIQSEMAARIVTLAVLFFVPLNSGWTAFQAYNFQLLGY